jgi:hypothetical protein
MRLEINDVCKTYRGGKQAVANVSMRIGPDVLGLLGSQRHREIAADSTMTSTVSALLRHATGTSARGTRPASVSAGVPRWWTGRPCPSRPSPGMAGRREDRRACRTRIAVRLDFKQALISNVVVMSASVLPKTTVDQRGQAVRGTGVSR